MYQNKRVLQESELKILGVAAKKTPTAIMDVNCVTEKQ